MLSECLQKQAQGRLFAVDLCAAPTHLVGFAELRYSFRHSLLMLAALWNMFACRQRSKRRAEGELALQLGNEDIGGVL